MRVLTPVTRPLTGITIAATALLGMAGPANAASLNHTPDIPSGLHTSPATACPAATTSIIGDGPLSLYALVSDPDGGALGVEFDLWKTADDRTVVASSDPAKLTYSSGSTAVFNVPQTTLEGAAASAVTRFSWKVRVTDGRATSKWSATCGFDFDPTRPGAPIVSAPADETTTVSQPASVAVAPPTTGTLPSFYSYQLNAGPPATVTADASGHATIVVTPTWQTNTLTVTSLSAGRNVGGSVSVTFNSAPAPTAKDGDLTGDGRADLVTAGSANGLPAGLWLAPGDTTGSSIIATNIGSTGLISGQPSDFDGAQVSTGHFTGYGPQDVLAYFPGGPRAGSAAILQGTGTASAVTGEFQWVSADYLTDNNGLSPIAVANAGDSSGQDQGFADLIGISGSASTGYYLDYYPAGPVTGFWQLPVQLGTATPTGQVDWNNWTITAAQTAGGTAMFLWNSTTGDLYLWQDLAFDLNTGLLTYTPVKLASGWNAGTALTLRAADINADGTPDLWTVGTGALTTAWLVTDLTATTGTIAAQPSKTLITSS